MIALTAEAWHFFGFGVGQAQIIAIGLVVATGIVVGYRITHRGDRYER